MRDGTKARKSPAVRAGLTAGALSLGIVPYRLPDPCVSEDEQRRWSNQDVTDMDNVQLWRETKRVENALAWTPEYQLRRVLVMADQIITPEEWLLARLTALREESGQRSG